jgi:hypothetical protein
LFSGKSYTRRLQQCQMILYLLCRFYPHIINRLTHAWPYAHRRLATRRERGGGWQRGQKWLLRPAIVARRMAAPQRGQGFPVRW